MKKNIIALLLSAALITGFGMLAQKASAIDVGLNEINNTIQLGKQDPRVIISKIINTGMMFLGIIAVVIVLAGGFKWMTAAGNEDKIGEAKKIMSAGVVGLVIVLASWGIAQFILTQLVTATNN